MTKGRKKIFLAGATGVIGQRLSRLLLNAGYTVYGTTRSIAKTAQLQQLGVNPVVVDVFDAAALKTALLNSQANIVIHQLTDLPPGLDPARMSEARARNARLREEGTRNLVAAAVAAGVQRVVAQSIAFAYAPGPQPFAESCPLNTAADDAIAARSAQAVASLEQHVLNGPFFGIVLRYGKLYGAGTGFEQPPTGGPLHADAAAQAALLAITAKLNGVYNIAEEDGTVTSARARRELGWSPDFRMPEQIQSK